jgi:hypothetical protein
MSLQEAQQSLQEAQQAISHSATRLREAKQTGAKRLIVALFVAAVSFYLFAAGLVGFAAATSSVDEFLKLLKAAYIDPLVIHVAIVAVFVALLAVPWHRWIEGKD